MDKETVEVSIIVPTYNRKEVLQRTVAHLGRQTVLTSNYEVIVVDDSSVDGTGEFLKNVRTRYRFSYILNEKNLGRARTRNRGIEQAKGRYIIMIDDDIWVAESFIAEHLEVHKRYSEGVVAVGAILIAPGIANTAINGRCSAHHLWCYEEMEKHSDSLPYNFCKTANLSMSRELLNKVGLFNESFVHYGGEDTEFGYRLFRRNINLTFAKEAIGYHYHNETMDSLISKELERGKSYHIYERLDQEHKPDTETFFSPFYHAKLDIRSICYNCVKMILFTPLSRIINRLFVKAFNESPTLKSLLTKYLIPILQMQYYRYGIKKVIR